jgi:2'-5' RNA ligase
MALNAPLLERKFSCIMALAPPDITDLVLRWGQMFITPDMLYKDPEDPDGFGFEKEVHVTVKFGLHEGEPSEHLLRILEETQPFEIEIGPCTIFENELYDVVKFDVESDALRALNARISDELEVTDTYPDYHPHLTVAYVTKGTCNDLIGKPLVDPANAADFRFIVQSVVFSSKNKTKMTLFLGRPNLNPKRVTEAEEVSPPDSPSCQILSAILGESEQP